MKLSILTFLFLFTTAFAGDENELRVRTMEMGSEILVMDKIIIPAGESTYYFEYNCGLRFESAEVNRQLTKAHKMVITARDWFREDTEIGNVYLFNVFDLDVYKNQKLVSKMKLVCEDNSFGTIKKFKEVLKLGKLEVLPRFTVHDF